MSRKCANLQDKGDHIAFINSIRLTVAKYSLPQEIYVDNVRSVKPEDQKQEGYIVAGSVIAFTEHVHGQAKQDILNATLFTQLACDHKFNREREIVQWYRYYNQILGHLGFVIQNFRFDKYQASGSGLKMDEVVLEILAAVASGGETLVISATLDAMRRMSERDEGITLFDSHCHQSNGGGFQVCSCDQARNGDVSLTLGAFYYTSRQASTKVLFFSYNSSSIEFFKGLQRATLNSEIYSRVRSTIGNQLSIKAVHLVASIEI